MGFKGVGLRVWGLFQSGAVVGVAYSSVFLFSATVVFGQGAVLWGNASFLPGGAGGRDKSLGMGFSPKQERSLYMAVQNGCTFADGALLLGKEVWVFAWSNGSLIKQPLSLGGQVKILVKWQIKKKALWHEFPSAFCYGYGLVKGKQGSWDDEMLLHRA